MPWCQTRRSEHHRALSAAERQPVTVKVQNPHGSGAGFAGKNILEPCSRGIISVTGYKAKSKRVEESDVQIKEGLYRMVLAKYYTYPWRRSLKLKLLFRIIDQGEHHGVVLGRNYNVYKTKTGFRAGRRSCLVREFQQVTNKRIPRLDRIPLSDLQETVIVASVRTVTKDATGEPLHEINQYSVVSELKGEAK